MHKPWFLLLISPLACAKQTTPPLESSPVPSTSVSKAAPPSPSAPTSNPTPELGVAHAGGLTWDATAPLVRRAPKNSMRVAEYRIEGDERAELTVFYFGADQGGAVEDNVARWLSQFSTPAGSNTAQPKRSQLKVGSIPVHWVETQGTYSGGMMPGAPGAEPLADALLLGAIANGPHGAVFFKLVGPRASVERARNAFQALVQSLRLE